MKIKIYSKDTFVKAMESRNINDSTVESFTEFFICIDPTGGPDTEHYFKQLHNNVLNLKFDDCHVDETKWGNDIQAFYSAKAMIKEQADRIINFVKTIPEDVTINIHCTKGQSRSVAVASFLTGKNLGNQHVLNLLRESWTGK